MTDLVAQETRTTEGSLVSPQRFDWIPGVAAPAMQYYGLWTEDGSHLFCGFVETFDTEYGYYIGSASIGEPPYPRKGFSTLKMAKRWVEERIEESGGVDEDQFNVAKRAHKT